MGVGVGGGGWGTACRASGFRGLGFRGSGVVRFRV